MPIVRDWSPYAPYFRPDEFRCRCGCGMVEMDQDFMDWLLKVRLALQWPMVISSGYRCPPNNPSGRHDGHAADVLVQGAVAMKLLEIVQTRVVGREKVRGLGIRQHGPRDKRFFHLDMVEHRDALWSYDAPREQG